MPVTLEFKRRGQPSELACYRPDDAGRVADLILRYWEYMQNVTILAHWPNGLTVIVAINGRIMPQG